MNLLTLPHGRDFRFLSLEPSSNGHATISAWWKCFVLGKEEARAYKGHVRVLGEFGGRPSSENDTATLLRVFLSLVSLSLSYIFTSAATSLFHSLENFGPWIFGALASSPFVVHFPPERIFACKATPWFRLNDLNRGWELIKRSRCFENEFYQCQAIQHSYLSGAASSLEKYSFCR